MQEYHKKEQSPWGRLRQCVQSHRLLSLGVAILIVLVIIWAMASLGGDGVVRSQSYKKVNGVAGLSATIDYDCAKSCKEKYDFNVYIFNKDGQLLNAVRPSKDGLVQLAMPGGDYVMMVGKQLGKDKLFPQEKLVLKDGQQLNLKLHYGEGEL
jgi:hypothetical protein